MPVSNIGLGEAIGSGTSLRGYDMPITKGLQINAQNEWKRMQQEQAQAEKQQKKSERMSKLLSEDKTKWNNQEYAKKFREYYVKKLPELESALNSGDALKYAKTKTEIEGELGKLKMIDDDEYNINQAVQKGYGYGAAKAYQKEGLQGLLKDMDTHIVPYAFVDDSGHFEINPIKPKDFKSLNYDIKKRIEGAKKTTENVGGQLKTQLTDPAEIQRIKTEVIANIPKDDKARYMVTEDFKDFYVDFAKKNNIDFETLKTQYADEVFDAYISDRFDKEFVAPIKEKTAPKKSEGGGGASKYRPSYSLSGSRSPKFLFPTEADGSTIIKKASSQSAAKVDLTSVDGKIKVSDILNPRVVYNPERNTFLISGNVERGKTNTYEPTKEPIEVSFAEFTGAFDISEEGLKALVPSYKPKAKEKPKPSGAKAREPKQKMQAVLNPLVKAKSR